MITWSARLEKACGAFRAWSYLPLAPRLDRVFKEAGVRDLIVAFEDQAQKHATDRALLEEVEVERDRYRQIGDELQSEASRLAEWVRHRPDPEPLPYEVLQALLGVEGCVERWTEARTMNREVRDGAR